MKNVKLSAPWVTFYHEVAALFERDPEVAVLYDDAERVITLHVENARKADALTQILPSEKTFGNISVKINVVPANLGGTGTVDLFQAAFEGNPVASRFIDAGNPIIGMVTFLMFEKSVVQYYNDNMGDPNGNATTLYQTIAEDVFEGTHEGLYFSTDSEEPAVG